MISRYIYIICNYNNNCKYIISSADTQLTEFGNRLTTANKSLIKFGNLKGLIRLTRQCKWTMIPILNQFSWTCYKKSGLLSIRNITQLAFKQRSDFCKRFPQRTYSNIKCLPINWVYISAWSCRCSGHWSVATHPLDNVSNTRWDTLTWDWE